MEKRSALLLSQLFAFTALFGATTAPAASTAAAPAAPVYKADYVIVGSGPAGAAMAKLLSDDKKHSVILLEAGGNYSQNPLIQLSRNIPDVVFNRNAQFYWVDETITQPNLNRHFDYVTGRTLGGATSVNGTFWVRGSNQSFSKWEKYGGKEWSVSRIDRILKSLEHYRGDTEDPTFRGRKGPIHVRQTAGIVPTATKFADAFQIATGFPILTDYNDPKTPIGIDKRVQWTQKGENGKYRVSATTAFLNKHVVNASGVGVHGRKLQILTRSTALRAIWKGKKCIGVQVLQNGSPITVSANKEVIVCAGINSSQFLMLSGIGDKVALKGFGIPVIYNNKNVGVGLTDQAAVTALFSTNPTDPAMPAGDPNDIAQFYGFLPSPTGVHPKNREVQIVGSMRQLDAITGNTLVVGVVLANQKSKGSIQLQSNDPLQMPLVNLGVLTNDKDLQTLMGAFRSYILPIANALAAIDPNYQLITPSSTIINDDTLLAGYIRAVVDLPSTVHNYTGHCKMGPLKKGGVVDRKGRVHGVRGLRVADCSIAPEPTDGACMATAYMIGTNIALEILKEEGHHFPLPHVSEHAVHESLKP